jgi:hypothetical protein
MTIFYITTSNYLITHESIRIADHTISFIRNDFMKAYLPITCYDSPNKNVLVIDQQAFLSAISSNEEDLNLFELWFEEVSLKYI